ncbi:hypothetical protein AHAS_Ahas16G0160300 [Arachis hypogaea]
MISTLLETDYRPTQEYWDWWQGACHVRHAVHCDIVLDLLRNVPDHRRHARQARLDTRKPTRRERHAREPEGIRGPWREPARQRKELLNAESKEEPEYARHENLGDIQQDEHRSSPPPPPPMP